MCQSRTELIAQACNIRGGLEFNLRTTQKGDGCPGSCSVIPRRLSDIVVRMTNSVNGRVIKTCIIGIKFVIRVSVSSIHVASAGMTSLMIYGSRDEEAEQRLIQ